MIDKWTGFYTYEVGYPYEQRSIPFKFRLDWVLENGIIRGTCIDEESKTLFHEPALVQGFIEDDFVSFIKKYLCCWGYNESNDLVIIDNMPAPEIHYSGNYIEKHFEGIWEMTINIKDAGGRNYERYCSGTGLMKMVKK